MTRLKHLLGVLFLSLAAQAAAAQSMRIEILGVAADAEIEDKARGEYPSKYGVPILRLQERTVRQGGNKSARCQYAVVWFYYMNHDPSGSYPVLSWGNRPAGTVEVRPVPGASRVWQANVPLDDKGWGVLVMPQHLFSGDPQIGLKLHGTSLRQDLLPKGTDGVMHSTPKSVKYGRANDLNDGKGAKTFTLIASRPCG